MPIRAIGRHRGFTLIELLVVLAILVGLGAAFPLAWERLSPVRQLQVSTARLRSDLSWLRSQAMQSNTITALSVAADGHAYSFGSDHSRELPGAVRMQLLAPDGTAVPPLLRFFPDGSSSGGALRLVRDGRIATLRVSALSGGLSEE